MRQVLTAILILWSILCVIATIIYTIKGANNEVIMLREYMSLIFATLAYLVYKTK